MEAAVRALPLHEASIKTFSLQQASICVSSLFMLGGRLDVCLYIVSLLGFHCNGKWSCLITLFIYRLDVLVDMDGIGFLIYIDMFISVPIEMVLLGLWKLCSKVVQRRRPWGRLHRAREPPQFNGGTSFGASLSLLRSVFFNYFLMKF